jgi:hypothetical protein
LRFNLPAMGRFIKRTQRFFNLCVAPGVVMHHCTVAAGKPDIGGFCERAWERAQTGQNLFERL